MELFSNMKFTWCFFVVFCVTITDGHVMCKFEKTPRCPSKDQYACEPVGVPYQHRCIPVTDLCNGKCDCQLGDDEDFCHLVQPAVTETVTTTQTVYSTPTLTITPTVSVNATSVLTSQVVWVNPSYQVSAFTEDIGIGTVACSKLTKKIKLTESAWRYTEVKLPTSSTMLFTLPCSATTVYP